MSDPIVTDPIPYLGHPVVLVDREQLRFRLHGRTCAVPYHLSGIDAPTPPPATFDWTKGRKVKLPILGNSKVGDCYLADPLHLIQIWTFQHGSQAVFVEQDAINRYYKMTGGRDSGLGDSDVFPAWKTGFLAVNGQYRILDEMTVDPSDDTAVALGMYYFCGASYTCTLCNNWYRSGAPGVIWDMPGGGTAGGHAMAMSGKNSRGNYPLETWGIGGEGDGTQGVEVTPRGLKASDPEITIQYSSDMFDPLTGLSPAGLTWEESRALWKLLGGKDVGASPFNPPPPPDPGTPVGAGMIRVLTAIKAGATGSIITGSDLVPGDYEALLGGDGPPPSVP
jgi:hypothetical protein